MKKSFFALVVTVSIFGVIGCNVGNAPAGQSADEAKAAFEQKTPDEKIKVLEASPMNPKEKAEKIAQIRKENNIPEPGGSAPASAPQGGPGSGAPQFPGDPRSAK